MSTFEQDNTVPLSRERDERQEAIDALEGLLARCARGSDRYEAGAEVGRKWAKTADREVVKCIGKIDLGFVFYLACGFFDADELRNAHDYSEEFDPSPEWLRFISLLMALPIEALQGLIDGLRDASLGRDRYEGR